MFHGCNPVSHFSDRARVIRLLIQIAPLWPVSGRWRIFQSGFWPFLSFQGVFPGQSLCQSEKVFHEKGPPLQRAIVSRLKQD